MTVQIKLPDELLLMLGTKVVELRKEWQAESERIDKQIKLSPKLAPRLEVAKKINNERHKYLTLNNLIRALVMSSVKKFLALPNNEIVDLMLNNGLSRGRPTSVDHLKRVKRRAA